MITGKKLSGITGFTKLIGYPQGVYSRIVGENNYVTQVVLAPSNPYSTCTCIPVQELSLLDQLPESGDSPFQSGVNQLSEILVCLFYKSKINLLITQQLGQPE